MTRLQSELHRLYAVDTRAGDAADTSDPTVRALVLEVTRPASWPVLSTVWHGVQAELALPAPAIAVSGTDGLQLWFSLAQAVTVPRAQAFLDSLRLHFLPDIDPKRIRLHPGIAAPTVPAEQGDTGNWSAFVAPDLAPVFADTPWLDIAPNEEGQASLLSGLRSTKPADFEAAVERLQGARGDAAAAQAESPGGPASTDPERFLRQVMNDASVPLALRIDAAKALLPSRR